MRILVVALELPPDWFEDKFEQPADPIPAGEWIANKIAATT